MRVRLLLVSAVCLMSVGVEAQTSGVQSSGRRASDQEMGKRFEVRPEALPKPYEGPAVRNTSLVAPRGDRKPILPAGFEATLFAENLEGPRQAIVLPNGDLLVAMQSAGALMLLRDADGDGHAEWIQRYAGGFDRPNGLAFRDKEILVADQQGIWTLGWSGAQRPPSPAQKKAAEVPPEARQPDIMDGQKLLTAQGVFGLPQGHANRDIEVGPDGRLYVGVGTTGNIGVEPEPKATVQSFAADGSDQKTVIAGVRNPVGLAFHPDTGELWVTVQERDGVGDRLVPDFLARGTPSAFYGFPYAYIGPNPQPGFANRAPDKVKATQVPDLLFEPHSAAMDFVFYTGPNVPAGYRGDAIVALKGSWNRTDPTGYKIVRVKFEGGKPVGWYDNFITGFWIDGDDKAVVWGRPADVALAPDGTLFVVDDTGGTIWRVTAKTP